MARNIDLISSCPNCNRKHSESNKSRISLISSKGKYSTVHITCGSCKVPMLALISKGSVGLISLGMMVDLDENETKNFISETPVSADEVIEVHKALKLNKFNEQPKYSQSKEKIQEPKAK